MPVTSRTVDGDGPHLFGDQIDFDPWVAFHGTSSAFEAQIDSVGLNSNRALFSKDEIAAVVSVFDRVQWAGEHLGGLVVLKPWSLGFDRAPGERPRLYLAESSHRASLYATRDFCGGEAARALRYAFQDLRRYADGSAGDGTALDREWVASQIERLGSTEKAAFGPLENHLHGVVYAIRLTPVDVPYLEYNSSMGIIAASVIPPEKLFAKAVVPAGWQHAWITDRRRVERLREVGLITAIGERRRAAQKPGLN
jgi:hypothetical protein